MMNPNVERTAPAVRAMRRPLWARSSSGAVAAVAFASAFVARPALADLTPAFQAKLTVDAEFVTGATGATDIAFAADGRAVITTKAGVVVVRGLDGLKVNIPGKFGTVDQQSEKGLLGVVADPNAPDTFYFYVSNGPSDTDKHYVYKGTLSAANELTVDLAHPIVGGSVQGGPGLEGPQNHDGGGLAIYNGQLYVGVGDTGFNSSPPQNKYGSCLNKPNGKILRVNLDGSIPTDNPLYALKDTANSVTTCATETAAFATGKPDARIFAWGFRNPWRFWIDQKTGLLWVGDVGETTREEIDVGGGNQHYGYPFIEGAYDWTQNGQNFGVSCDTVAPGRPCTGPVYDYPHANNTPAAKDKNQASVTGGLIPEGCGWNKVFGDKPNYIFADYAAGWIRALEVNSARDGVTNAANPTAFGTFDGGPVSFRMGPGGSLYVVLVASGAVYKLTPTDQTGADCGAPVGGTGGAGGASGTGGAPGTAGGTSGASGGTATNAGGTRNAGGVANAATGGLKGGTGGAGAMMGGAALGGSGSSGLVGTKSGCGCRVGDQPGGILAGFVSIVALLGGFGLRRKLRDRA